MNGVLRSLTCRVVWDVACKQAYALNHSSAFMTGCTQAHSHTHAQTHADSRNIKQPFPGEWVHTLLACRVAHTATCQNLACGETKRGNSIKSYMGFTFLLLRILLFGTLRIVWERQRMNFFFPLSCSAGILKSWLVLRDMHKWCNLCLHCNQSWTEKVERTHFHHCIASIALSQGGLMISTDAYLHMHLFLCRHAA